MPCLLILLTVSLTEQKFLILMKPSLSSVSLMDQSFVLNLSSFCHTQGYISKLSSAILSYLFYMLFYDLFLVSFVKSIRSGSKFFLLFFSHMDV